MLLPEGGEFFFFKSEKVLKTKVGYLYAPFPKNSTQKSPSPIFAHNPSAKALPLKIGQKSEDFTWVGSLHPSKILIFFWSHF